MANALNSSLASPTPVANQRPRAVPSTELQLLLATCSPARRNSPRCDLQALQGSDFDWKRILQLAEHHGVTPALYSALRHSENVPPAVLDQLRERYEQNVRKNLKFAGELFRILDCLRANAIPAIPLKGLVLAEILFGDLAQRELSDLDVLVRPEDVARAKRALHSVGYVAQSQGSEVEERAYLATGYEYTFDGPAGRNLLEVQWNILPRFYAIEFNCPGFFERAVPVEVAGRGMRTLCAEDLLLTLCVHAAKHAWARLCWLRDIAGTIESQPLDWEKVRGSAYELGISRMVGVSVLLVHRLLNAAVPDAMLQSWSTDPATEPLVDEATCGLSSAEFTSTESLHYFRLMLRLRERTRDRVRFLCRLALTPGPGEWSAIRLPAPLFPLYRIVRLFRLAGRGVGFRTRDTHTDSPAK